MELRYLKNPYLLLELGFIDLSEPSTDFVRTILLEKKIKHNSFRIRAHFTQFIADNPFGTYSENNQFDFEEFSISTSEEEDSEFVHIKASTIRELNTLIRLI